MRHDPVQKGNPHRLTVQQHTFPKRSIERFTEAGTVEVFEPASKRLLRRNPKDVLFCAHRAWDHRTEHQTFASIELRFQQIADELLDGATTIDQLNREAITEFYLSWVLRYAIKQRPRSDYTLRPTGLDRTSEDLDTAEFAEKNGYIFIRRDGSIPGRMMHGAAILTQIGARQEGMEGMKWGIVRAGEGAGEFIVPDTFSRFPIIPISPKMSLIGGFENYTATFSAVADINGLAVANAEHYYFARMLTACPIRRHAVISYAIRGALHTF